MSNAPERPSTGNMLLDCVRQGNHGSGTGPLDLDVHFVFKMQCRLASKSQNSAQDVGQRLSDPRW